jgi:dsRNA-specific ribonuclease
LTKADRRRRILEKAWVGDAVLCLYARRAVLAALGTVDGARFTQLTSNRFLARFGEPSEVEAEIGRIYERDGLEAAFQWIEQTMGASFAKVLAADTGRSHK